MQQIDPHWRPLSALSRDSQGDYEVMIRAKEAEREEAEARFVALSRAGRDHWPFERDVPRVAELVRPSGEIVGYRQPGAGENVRTVTPAEFESLRLGLMRGSRLIEADREYDGVWYKRPDGSIFGLRLSRDHGLTLDIIEGNDPVIPHNLRIHQR